MNEDDKLEALVHLIDSLRIIAVLLIEEQHNA